MKYRTIWVRIDCQWNTVREAYDTKKEALKETDCKKCRIVKFVEVK